VFAQLRAQQLKTGAGEGGEVDFGFGVRRVRADVAFSAVGPGCGRFAVGAAAGGVARDDAWRRDQ
jgi:hypothetical protein